MGLVAFFAIGSNDISRVRLVALGTWRNLAVHIVAEGAVQFAVLARELLQLFDLLGMAGETWISNIAAEGDDFRGMRVAVTVQAAGKLEVRLTFVAHAALWNRLLNSWWVTLMAILAADFRFVGFTVGLNVCRWLGMAFYAVGVGKTAWLGSWCRFCSKDGSGQQECTCCQQ